MDNLEIINRVMFQHKVFVGQLESAGESLSDIEALLRLETARRDLILDFRQTLSEKRNYLESIIIPLDQGLRKHYAFEEEMLPPLLGRLLTEALIFEHKQLLLLMEETVSSIREITEEGLIRTKEAEKESQVYRRMENLRKQKMDHLNREDAVLLTLKNVIELETKQLI